MRANDRTRRLWTLVAATSVIAVLVLAACGEAWGRGGIQGTWLPVTAELGGRPFPDDLRKTIKLVVEGGSYTVTMGPMTDRGMLKLRPDTEPKGLDITGTRGPNAGKTILGIYERRGDTLKVCYQLGGGGERPREFRSVEGTQLFLVTYQRQRKSEAPQNPEPRPPAPAAGPPSPSR